MAIDRSTRRQVFAEVAVARFSESAGAEDLGSRNRVLVRDALLLLGSLIIAKEEQLVFKDGAADRSAKLLPGRGRERNSGLIGEWIASLLIAVAIVIKAAAMEVV